MYYNNYNKNDACHGLQNIVRMKDGEELCSCCLENTVWHESQSEGSIFSCSCQVLYKGNVKYGGGSPHGVKRSNVFGAWKLLLRSYDVVCWILTFLQLLKVYTQYKKKTSYQGTTYSIAHDIKVKTYIDRLVIGKGHSSGASLQKLVNSSKRNVTEKGISFAFMAANMVCDQKKMAEHVADQGWL